MRVEPHHTAEELAALIRSEPKAKVARRLAVVRLVLLGQAPEQVPRVLLSARQIPTCIGRYNAGPRRAGRP